MERTATEETLGAANTIGYIPCVFAYSNAFFLV